LPPGTVRGGSKGFAQLEVAVPSSPDREGGVAAGARAVTGHLIDVFAAAGEPGQVATRLREYTAAGLRGLLAWHVFGPDPHRGLELLATEVAPAVW
jgi:alkanesulfonate monooxygenase SsuD/methylene tetrahydromethanopterin reductase-like flavin-dependent oxidoreductase (luciferase family)